MGGFEAPPRANAREPVPFGNERRGKAAGVISAKFAFYAR